MVASQTFVRAFQSGTASCICYDCRKQERFFKLFQSYRPDHSWRDDEGRTKATLFCLDCELKRRQEEWESWSVEEKEAVGELYATLDQVRIDQKKVCKKSWAMRSDPIVNAKISLKALRDTRLQAKSSSSSADPPDIRVNFVQCMEEMRKEDVDDPDGMDVDDGARSTYDSMWSVVPLGASNDGPGGGPAGASDDGPLDPKRQRTQFLPEGRSEADFQFTVLDAQNEMRLTSKQFKRYIIRRSKDLARALLGMMKINEDTLGAFAAAGNIC